MNITIALPHRWANDLGALTMLCALHGQLASHHITMQAAASPRDQKQHGPTAGQPDNADLWAEEKPGQSVAADADIVILPVSQGCAAWALAWLQQCPVPVVLYIGDLATTPSLVPALIARASGVLVPDEQWYEWLHAALPNLPVAWVPPDDPAPTTAQGSAAATAQQSYLLTWAPATATSIMIITEAFASLAEMNDALHLVVIGEHDHAAWRQWLRAYGLWHRAWVLDDAAYARADALVAMADAVIAPLSPSGRSAALLTALARSRARRLIELTPQDDSWIAVRQGIPQISTTSHQAAKALSLSLQLFLAATPHILDTLARLRPSGQGAAAAAQEKDALDAFLSGVCATSPGNHPASTSALGDLAGHMATLASSSLSAMGLTALDPHLIGAIAQCIAGLTLPMPGAREG